MPGFYVSNIRKNFELVNKINDMCVKDDLSNDKFIIKRNTIDKFMDDKCFVDSEKYIIILEGVIFNKKEIMDKTGYDSWKDYLIDAVEKDRCFFAEFRGSFSGGMYIKSEKKWIFYTNQIGDKAVFYYAVGGRFCVASQVNYILEAMREENLKRTLDNSAVYNMLTFGFMEQNQTYLQEIKRLLAGTYLEIDEHGNTSVHTYHRFTHMKYDYSQKSEEELMDIVEEAFTRAVKLEYDKDKEYGYAHLADLSGGLDSRMTTWVAYENGYTPQQNITYCKSNYEDEMIAKEIAAYCGNDLLAKPLDDLNWVYDLNDIVDMNFGLSLYAGITGGKRLLESLNWNKFGLEHTGQLGDAVLGAYCSDMNELESVELMGMYSSRLSERIPNDYRKLFSDTEIYKLYTRGFGGILCSHLIRQNFTEVASPFLDVDFLEICYSIPFRMRMQEVFYQKWIISKHRKAADFRWEKIRGKITDPAWKKTACKVFRKGKGMLRRVFKAAVTDHMNPMQYWYDSTPKMREFMNNTYKNSKAWQYLSEDAAKDVRFLFENGTTMEKFQVLTCLRAIELYMR